MFDRGRLERVVDLTHRYVDEGRLPGTSVLVHHAGDVVLRDVHGMADLDTGRKLADDTIFRIYSMTKPIVSIAAMQLYEQGRLLLEDPVGRYIPSFADLRVYDGPDPRGGYRTVEAAQPVTIRDLLIHTSGISAWFQLDPVAELYRERDVVRGRDESLAEHIERLATLPLLFQPGSRWHYGSSTDVLGRVVELIADAPLDAHLRRSILGPLGMDDTDFWVPPEKAGRFCANYRRDGRGLAEVDGSEASPYLARPAMLSGAGGMVGTVDDYHRFVRMLLGGGELEGERILGPRTLSFMTRNHLPGGRDLVEAGSAVTFSEASMAGVGFGLGFSVLLDPAANQAMGSPGQYAWGGMASTYFWVDPAEELAVVFMTQLMPSTYYPIRRQLQATVYQAITG